MSEFFTAPPPPNYHPSYMFWDMSRREFWVAFGFGSKWINISFIGFWWEVGDITGGDNLFYVGSDSYWLKAATCGLQPYRWCPLPTLQPGVPYYYQVDALPVRQQTRHQFRSRICSWCFLSPFRAGVFLERRRPKSSRSLICWCFICWGNVYFSIFFVPNIAE